MGAMSSFFGVRTLQRRIVLGALIFGGVVPKLAAQLPRMAPPPPCRIPARVVVPPINGVFREKESGVTLAVLPIEGNFDAADRGHVPWALQNRLTGEFSRNDRFRVLTQGSVSRALYESGGAKDSAAALLGARYVLSGELSGPRGSEIVALTLHRRGQATPLWKASLGASWTLQRMVVAIVDGVQRTVFRERELEATKARPPAMNDAAYDALAAGDYALYLTSLANPDSARAMYDKALAADRKSPAVLAHVAQGYAIALERGAHFPGFTPEGARNQVHGLAVQALTRDPSLGSAWTARAILARLRDPVHFNGALFAHARAVALSRTDALAEYEYGVTLRRLGIEGSAETHLRRSLALEPNRPATLAALSELAVRNSQWAEACAYSNVSITAWPFDPAPYASRARARIRLAQTRDAYSDAETAAKLSPGVWMKALLVLIDADASNEEGARDQATSLATTWLTPGRTLDVRDATYLSLAYMAVGDRRRAVEALRRARPLGVDLVTALRDKGFDAIRGDTAVTRLIALSANRLRKS
jgi:tetratricopeptide (TPR) repeat protein